MGTSDAISLVRGKKLYAGALPPQGPFLFENNLFPLKVGLRWAFVNLLIWVQKVGKSGSLGRKNCVKMRQTHFLPTLNPFRGIDKNLSAPNHKSLIASDFKLRSPNRKNIPQIAVRNASNPQLKSRDL